MTRTKKFAFALTPEQHELSQTFFGGFYFFFSGLVRRLHFLQVLFIHSSRLTSHCNIDSLWLCCFFCLTFIYCNFSAQPFFVPDRCHCRGFVAMVATAHHSPSASRSRSPQCHSHDHGTPTSVSSQTATARLSVPRALREPLLAMVERYGSRNRILSPLLTRKDTWALNTLAFDGFIYDRRDFVAFYGNDRWFFKYRWCTYMAADFLTTLCHHAKQTGSDSVCRALLRLVNLEAHACDPGVAAILHVKIFRALLLREEVLDVPADDYVCDVSEQRALIQRVRQWTDMYYTLPNENKSQAYARFWHTYFGHRNLALAVATSGVASWFQTAWHIWHASRLPVGALETAIARSSGSSSAQTPSLNPGVLAFWR